MGDGVEMGRGWQIASTAVTSTQMMKDGTRCQLCAQSRMKTQNQKFGSKIQVWAFQDSIIRDTEDTITRDRHFDGIGFGDGDGDGEGDGDGDGDGDGGWDWDDGDGDGDGDGGGMGGWDGDGMGGWDGDGDGDGM